MMKGFSFAFLKALRWGLRKKSWLMALFIAFNIFLALQIPHLKAFYSTDELHEEKISSLNEWREFKKNFRESQTSFFVISPQPPRVFFSEQELCNIQKTVDQIPRLNDLVKSTQTSLDIRQAFLDAENRLRFPLLIDINCAAPKKTADEMLTAFQMTGTDLSSWENNLLSKKHNDIAILVSYAAGESDQAFPVGKVEQIWNFAEKSFLNDLPGAKVYSVGGADYQAWVAKARHDTAWVYVAVLLGIVFGLRLILGTWLGGALYMVSLVSCLTILYGLKSMLGSPTDLLSNTMVPLLAIATLEDFVFVSFIQLKDRFHWRKSLRVMLLPSFWTSLTTFIGFGSLVVSDLNIIQRLGLWAAIGCMLEWLILFYGVPLALPLVFKKRNWVNAQKSILAKSGDFFTRAEKVAALLLNPLCRISLIALPVIIFLSPALRVTDSLEEVFKKKHPFSQGLQYVQETRGWKGRIELKLREGLSEDKLTQILGGLQQGGLVTAFDRAGKTKAFITARLPQDFIPLGHRLAESSEYVSSFIGLDGSQRVTLYLSDNSTVAFTKLKDQLTRLCSAEDCQLVGSLYTKTQFTQVVAETFIESSILSLVLIVAILIFLALSLGRIREALPMIIASLWAPLALFSIIKCFEISINFITCIVITVLVGLAGDNVIQFLFAGRKSTLAGIGHLKGGAASCFVLMALVSLLFMLAPFQPVRTMGALTALGFIAILIGDVLVLKLLLHIRLKKLSDH